MIGLFFTDFAFVCTGSEVFITNHNSGDEEDPQSKFTQKPVTIFPDDDEVVMVLLSPNKLLD